MKPPAATLYADPARMRAWMESAAPGHSTIYASGVTLEGGDNPAARLAREWQQQGLAELFGPNTRRFGEGRYVAVKRGAPCGAAAAGGGLKPGSPAALVFDWLRRRHERDAGDWIILHSLAWVAKEAAVPGPRGHARQRARYALAKLVKLGLAELKDTGGERLVRLAERALVGV